MDIFDEKIKEIINKQLEEPSSYSVKIKKALYKREKHKKNSYRKILAIAASIIAVTIGTFGVYAANGGTINGKLVTDLLGIKVSDKYEDYKKQVNDQVIKYENTSIGLTSVLCNDGITILEFDVKLSQEDSKKLNIGKSMYTEDIEKQQQETLEREKKRLMNMLKNDKFNKKMKEVEYESNEQEGKIWNDTIVTDEDFENSDYYAQYQKTVEESNKATEQMKNTKLTIGLALNVEQKGGTYAYDKYNPDMDWYGSLYIDDVPYYVSNWQRTEQISDYEFKIYTLYMITDDELQGKEDFKITLKNNKLVNRVDWPNIETKWINDCQWFARTNNGEEVIDLDGEYEAKVSKQEVLEDSTVIENPGIKSEFRNITQTVEKIVNSPIQIIVEVNHQASKQSSNALKNRYSDHTIEHLPITRQYKVYDADGKELSCFAATNKNTLIYNDGTREDYDRHDIPNKTYSNAIWERRSYLLIENTDSEYIKIVPIETVLNPITDQEAEKGNNYTGQAGGEIFYEMDPLIIKLKGR